MPIIAERRLVLNADDFGMSPGMNASVKTAFSEGRLSSVSIMAGAPASVAAAQMARSEGIPVGVHLSFVDASPVSPVEKIPGLVGRDGRLGKSPVAAGLKYFLRSGLAQQLEIEARAQMDWFVRQGLKPDHLDGHVNMHIHPRIFPLVLKLCEEYKIPAVRLPAEPAGWIMRCGMQIPVAPYIGFALLALSASHRARLNGLAKSGSLIAPQYSFGHAEYPCLDLPGIMRWINNSNYTFVEIAFHLDDEDQVDSLLSDEFGKLVKDGGWRIACMGENKK